VQKKNLSGQQELTIKQAKTDPKQLVRDGIKIQFRNVLNAEKPGTTDATAEAANTLPKSERPSRINARINKFCKHCKKTGYSRDEC